MQSMKEYVHTFIGRYEGRIEEQARWEYVAIARLSIVSQQANVEYKFKIFANYTYEARI